MFYLLLFPLNSFASWNSYVINFNKNLYGKGNQTWQISSYNQNWTYFANQNGLLQFDGNLWSVYPLKNKLDVRSVLASNIQKRIYVGGINEFGYFEPNSKGEMSYICMSDSLKSNVNFLGNIWGIHEIDNIMYFQGDGGVIKYLNGKYTAIPINAKIDCSSVIEGILYIGTDRGVWVLVGNTFFPLPGADNLSTKRIRGMIPHKAGLLIVTAYSGLFYCDGVTTVPYITGAESFMKENEVFTVASQDNLVALGTIHKGVIVIDTLSKKNTYYNEYNGLQNNTVLSLEFDKSGNLWTGLDIGIDYICINSQFTNLYSYPYSYGTGYAAAIEKDKLYLGTNRGLFITSYPVNISENLPKIEPIPNSSGQVWNICKIGDDIFCLHDRGLYLIEGKSMKKISDISGAWICKPVLEDANKMFVGVYNGLYLFQKQNGVWRLISKIDGIDDSCRIFEQESDRILWIHNSLDVRRIVLDETLTKVIDYKSINLRNTNGSSLNIYPTKIEGKIYFITTEGLYKFNPIKQCMEKCDNINNLLYGTSAYSRVIEYKEKLISLSPHEICIANLGTYKRGSNTTIYPISQSLIEPVPTFEAIFPISDSLLIIPNEEGFALFKIPKIKNGRDLRHSVFIRHLYITYPKDSLIYSSNFLGIKPIPKIDYGKSIRFEYGLSFHAMGNDVNFQYRLNQEQWSDYTQLRTKEFGNLTEGEYKFEVKVIYPDGNFSRDEISFIIMPPWYRTTLFYIIYIIITIALLWQVYIWDDRRVKRKNAQIVKEKDKQLYKMEKQYEAEREQQEKHIMQLQKEKLEYDLKHKSQEIANLLINFARKNEILNEIKSDIVKTSALIKGEPNKEAKILLTEINSKIDSNIHSDKVLKKIEDEFDLIHNNFMKKLNLKHPNLSTNEKMICVYLKMNLSTKEISQLLNISIRGVETIRYRLRKKVDLDRGENLIDYLANKI